MARNVPTGTDAPPEFGDQVAAQIVNGELAGQEDPRLESIFLHLTGGDGDSSEQTEFIHH